MSAIVVVSTDDAGQYVRVTPECPGPRYDTPTSWPQKTDILCWQCCHHFDTMPLPLPMQYDSRRDTFKVAGTFCSWSCMTAYNRDHNRMVLNRGPHALAISLFHKRMTGSTKSISPAPPKFLLKIFGGYMDIDEYRKHSETHVMDILPPKCIMPSQVVYDRRISETRRTMASKISDLDEQVDLSNMVPSKYGDTLKLRRPKHDLPSPSAAASTSKRKTKAPTTSMLELTLGLAPPSA